MDVDAFSLRKYNSRIREKLPHKIVIGFQIPAVDAHEIPGSWFW